MGSSLDIIFRHYFESWPASKFENCCSAENHNMDERLESREALHCEENHLELHNILEKIHPLIALHRLITLHQNIPEWGGDFCEKLAASGLFKCCYLPSNILICAFCQSAFNVHELKMETVEKIEKIDEIHKNKCPGCSFFGEESDDVPLDASFYKVFKFESHRLASFFKLGNWDSAVTIFDLAKNGFYYIGPEDNVRCEFCKLEVRGWEEGDQVEEEHRRWNPNCPFANGGRHQNIKIGDEKDSEEYKEYFLSLKGRRAICGMKVKLFRKGQRSSLKSLNIHKFDPAKNYRMNTFEKRLNSFKNWPKCLAQKPCALAAAGFYYTGNGDRVNCFFCGVGLKDWDGQDDPYVQHAQWSSTCQFMALQKGEEFIKRVVGNRNASSDSVIVGEFSGSKKGEKWSLTCSDCGDNIINTVNLPCGHMNLCGHCSKEGSSCASCKNVLSGCVHIYL